MNAGLLLWLPFDLVHDLGWTLIHFLWQGALLAFVLELSLLACRQARTRYAVAFAALLLMALAPFATFLVVHVSPIQVAPLDALPSIWPALETAFAGSDDAPFVRAILWMNWLVLAWLVGVLAFAVRFAGGWYAGRRLIHHHAGPLPAPLLARCAELARIVGVARPVRFLQSAAVQVPAVVGWLRPVLLLPVSVVTGFTPQQLEVLILHELAHIRRLDVVANLIQVAVETVLFYHPGVWWVSRRIRIERENCCDDLAVALSGDTLAYVRALATLAERHALPAPAVAAAGGVLKQRIERLLGLRVTSGNASTLVVAAIAIACLAVSVAAGSISPAANADTVEAAAQGVEAPAPVPAADREPATSQRAETEAVAPRQQLMENLRRHEELLRLPEEDTPAAAAIRKRLTESLQRQQELLRLHDESMRISDEAARTKVLTDLIAVSRQQLQSSENWQRAFLQGRLDSATGRLIMPTIEPLLSPPPPGADILVPDVYQMVAATRSEMLESLRRQPEQIRLRIEAERISNATARKKALANLEAANLAAVGQRLTANLQTQQERAQQGLDEAALIPDPAVRKQAIAERRHRIKILQLQQEQARLQLEAERIPDQAAREEALGRLAAAGREIRMESQRQLREALLLDFTRRRDEATP